MNPSESKKLEEIDAKIDEWGANRKEQHWLISKVKEQDREIAGLRLDGWVDFSDAVAYQRRHRKWALGEAKLQARIKRQAKDMWYRFVDRTEKAEAELEAQLITYQAKIKEIDVLEARIKELEQELLWTAEACEKAETENSILRGLSQKGTIDRGSFAKHATETVETSEETRRLLAGKEEKG